MSEQPLIPHTCSYCGFQGFVRKEDGPDEALLREVERRYLVAMIRAGLVTTDPDEHEVNPS